MATNPPVNWAVLKALTDAGLSSAQIRALATTAAPNNGNAQTVVNPGNATVSSGQRFTPTVGNGQITLTPTTETTPATDTHEALTAPVTRPGYNNSFDDTPPPVAQPKIQPTQDPAFLAYQRALQANESTMRANIATQVAHARQQVQDAIPGLERRRKQGMQDIGMQHAGRGTWSSSQRLDDENNLDTDVNSQRSALENGATGMETDLQGQLSQQLAQNQIGLSDQEGQARERLGQGAAQSEADRLATWQNQVGQRRRNWIQQYG